MLRKISLFCLTVFSLLCLIGSAQGQKLPFPVLEDGQCQAVMTEIEDISNLMQEFKGRMRLQYVINIYIRDMHNRPVEGVTVHAQKSWILDNYYFPEETAVTDRSGVATFTAGRRRLGVRPGLGIWFNDVEGCEYMYRPDTGFVWIVEPY